MKDENKIFMIVVAVWVIGNIISITSITGIIWFAVWLASKYSIN